MRLKEWDRCSEEGLQQDRGGSREPMVFPPFAAASFQLNDTCVELFECNRSWHGRPEAGNRNISQWMEKESTKTRDCGRVIAEEWGVRSAKRNENENASSREQPSSRLAEAVTTTTLFMATAAKRIGVFLVVAGWITNSGERERISFCDFKTGSEGNSREYREIGKSDLWMSLPVC